MDPATHRRFLNYLESYEYFRRPDTVKLDQAAFAVLDKELMSLLPREKSPDVTREEAARIRELRKALFRD